jgi:tRNA (cmo5U34)-methyltransferase
MSDKTSHIEAPNADWSFYGIEEQFDKHVEKSVPLYHEGHELICNLSDFFVPGGGLITEIGCSTGTLAKKLSDHHRERDGFRYQGIDSVAGMVEKAQQLCGEDSRICIEQGDIVTQDLEPSSMIISYYTMQFIHPKFRQNVFDKLYQSLEWGGALVLFEKVRAPDARFQDIASQIYNDFKLANNFTEKEILNKSRSLKGVQEPFSTQGNLDLMQRAGFEDVMTVAKWVCFEGFLAIK